ncbi:MAG: hypothetical protein RIB47_05940 [Cyclobacteriaceae bacterium]
MKNLSIQLFLFLPLGLYSQDLALMEYNNILRSWLVGEMVLNDGTRLTGMMQYNHYEGIIRVKQDDIIKSMLPRDFQSLTLLGNSKRQFLSIPFDIYKTGNNQPTLVEVLVEFDDFALMSVTSPLQAVRRPPNNNPAGNPDLQFEAQQTEFIYIFDDKGSMEKIMSIESYESSSWFRASKVKKRVYDLKLLKQYIPDADYAGLEAYAKEHDLSFKERTELIMILEHYKSVLRKREE